MSFGFFGYGMSFLIVFAFAGVSIIGFAGVLYYFLQQAFNSEDSLIVDTREEALNRKI